MTDRTQNHRRLIAHRSEMAGFDIATALADDPGRFETMAIEAGPLLLDFSRHLASARTLELLVDHARACGLGDWLAAVFRGDRVNSTEARPALHHLLRTPVDEAPEGLEAEHRAATDASDRMLRLVGEAERFEWRGSTGEPITDVVNIGIGGSHLGPELAATALAPYHRGGIRCHFLASIDGEAGDRLLASLKPASTAFIISSKSFTTLETLTNAGLARQWLRAAGISDANAHFWAVTAEMEKARAFGIDWDRILPIQEWVGGRFSLWSAIGLPVALSVGAANWQQLLAGAFAMDEHCRRAPLAANAPVRMALLEHWYVNYWEARSQVVLPYLQSLALLPDHLQQLTMESNGKQVSRAGHPLQYHTSPAVWGNTGTNGQHSFHQWLHQGTQLVPVDFILAWQSRSGHDDQHRQLVANALAQSRSLVTGLAEKDIEQDLLAEGYTEAEAKALAPHKAMPGNRPSTTIAMERLTPYALGALIALYEHKTVCLAGLWDTNPFDQWGVEHGKQQSKAIARALAGDEAPGASLDSATSALIERYQRYGA